jgi:hypothetical protein
MVPASYLGR